MSDRALRVAHVYPKEDFFTGAAVQLLELARGLAGRGHHVVVVSRPSPIWDAKCREAGLRHRALPMRWQVDLRSALALRRLLTEERIDLVHAHKGRARTLALLAGVVGRRPVLVLNRGVSFPIRGLRRLGYTSERVDAIVAVSDSIRQGLVAAGVPEGKITVIHSGTDLDRFHPAVDGTPVRRELGLEPEHFLITQVGVRSWRGWTDTLAAMARLAPQADHARLLLVGAATPRIAEVAERARASGVGDRVFALPKREDIPAVLAASDVVVDASWAGLGITGSIREALACERPVVATWLEGMPELVTDGETGLLVPPRAPEALARAIGRVLDDPAGARSMARAGRKRVEERFSLRVKLDATEALYRRLVAARGAR